MGSLSQTIEELYNKIESSWDVQEQTDKMPFEAFTHDLNLLRAKIEEQERSMLKNKQEQRKAEENGQEEIAKLYLDKFDRDIRILESYKGRFNQMACQNFEVIKETFISEAMQYRLKDPDCDNVKEEKIMPIENGISSSSDSFKSFEDSTNSNIPLAAAPAEDGANV